MLNYNKRRVIFMKRKKKKSNYIKDYKKRVLEDAHIRRVQDDEAILAYLDNPGGLKVNYSQSVIAFENPALTLTRIDEFQTSLIGLSLIENILFTPKEKDAFDVNFSIIRIGNFIESIYIIFDEGSFEDEDILSHKQIIFQATNSSKKTSIRYGINYNIYDRYNEIDCMVLNETIARVEKRVNERMDQLNKELKAIDDAKTDENEGEMLI
jgi:hypothetical protein